MRVRMKIQQVSTKYCKTREMTMTEEQFDYYSSIAGKPKNGFMVVYVEEI